MIAVLLLTFLRIDLLLSGDMIGLGNEYRRLAMMKFVRPIFTKGET